MDPSSEEIVIFRLRLSAIMSKTFNSRGLEALYEYERPIVQICHKILTFIGILLTISIAVCNEGFDMWT